MFYFTPVRPECGHIAVTSKVATKGAKLCQFLRAYRGGVHVTTTRSSSRPSEPARPRAMG